MCLLRWEITSTSQWITSRPLLLIFHLDIASIDKSTTCHHLSSISHLVKHSINQSTIFLIWTASPSLTSARASVYFPRLSQSSLSWVTISTNKFHHSRISPTSSSQRLPSINLWITSPLPLSVWRYQGIASSTRSHCYPLSPTSDARVNQSQPSPVASHHLTASPLVQQHTTQWILSAVHPSPILSFPYPRELQEQPISLPHSLKTLVSDIWWDDAKLDNIPASLTHLLQFFSTQPVQSLPPNLTQLSFGPRFNGSLHGKLPQTLLSLELGESYCQPLHSLPASLKALSSMSFLVLLVSFYTPSSPILF